MRARLLLPSILAIAALQSPVEAQRLYRLELSAAGIHVAEYLTVLPAPEILRQKLHQAIETARLRLESRDGENSGEEPGL